MSLYSDIVLALCRSGTTFAYGNRLRQALQMEPQLGVDEFVRIMDALARAEAQALLSCADEIWRGIHQREKTSVV